MYDNILFVWGKMKIGGVFRHEKILNVVFLGDLKSSSHDDELTLSFALIKHVPYVVLRVSYSVLQVHREVCDVRNRVDS